MATLEQSISNLSKYIINNCEYLLNGKCFIKYVPNHDYHELYIQSTTIIYIFDKKILVGRHDEYVLKMLIKLFNIPDFHITIVGFYSYKIKEYQTLRYLLTYLIVRDARVDWDAYLNLTGKNISKELLEDTMNHDNILGIILDENAIDDANIKLLFEQMNKLKYIWCGTTEYKPESSEYDYKLRIAELHCRNELLEGDYKNRYYFSCTNNIRKNPYNK